MKSKRARGAREEMLRPEAGERKAPRRGASGCVEQGIKALGMSHFPLS